MKIKGTAAALLLCCIIAVLPACSGNSEETNGNAPDELSSQTAEDGEAGDSPQETTEEQLKPRDREADTDSQYVFDDGGILSDGEYDSLNSYAAWLSRTFKINAAVVLTDDIGGSEPADYAKNCYESNYTGDGILFLINNDTKEDYLYRRGFTAGFMTDSETQMLFAEISPMLALGEYVTAAERVLEKAELSLPEYFTDRSGTLRTEEIAAYNDALEQAAGENSLNIYYVKGTGEEEMEDFAKKRFGVFYDSGADAAMLTVAADNGDVYLSASGSLEYMLDSKADIESAVKECYNEETGFDMAKAVERFIGFAE
ncbi:MAG: TPM domain-containing protein [Porcipelethomonas sp.]